jgi:hypothetical protein
LCNVCCLQLLQNLRNSRGGCPCRRAFVAL